MEDRESDGLPWKKILLTYLIFGTLIYAGVFLVLSLMDKPRSYKTNYSGVSRTTINASDVRDAKKQVETFYAVWLANSNRRSDPDFLDTHTESLMEKSLLTEKAATSVAENTGFDMPTCSQNPLPFQRYTFSNPIINENTARMTVTGTYDSPPQARIDVYLVKYNSVWSIDGFECPLPATDAR